MIDCFEYLVEQESEELGYRFLEAAQSTFGSLASMPGVGALCNFYHAPLRPLRRWPVKGFENWLIFYLPIAGGVEILALLHGARSGCAL